jgi:hypothetical protein
MNSLIYPEDGIVEVTLEKQPKPANAIYVYDLSWDGNDDTVEVALALLLSSFRAIHLRILE